MYEQLCIGCIGSSVQCVRAALYKCIGSPRIMRTGISTQGVLAAPYNVYGQLCIVPMLTGRYYLASNLLGAMGAISGAGRVFKLVA